ncbi:MAG: 1,6-anhydro-N-acetylmuramyl-L-alanine amidase AmpD [Pseudomonadales bacterium]|nr:1,6-anhydro-N-acetylmuramyl-L-alanine amidase AmpD [Pseudomonadales bacterium]
MLTLKDHRFLEAKQVPSPNFNERPVGCQPELIVVHSISLPPGQFGGPYIEKLFTNCLDSKQHAYFAEICHLEVSSHLLIARNGDLIQFVPFNKRAWHAGKSCFNGRENCNDFSIGIELEGTDTDAYEPIQYETLKAVLVALIKHYPGLNKDSITGHQDIAPERKTDPGPGFDWGYLNRLLDQVV